MGQVVLTIGLISALCLLTGEDELFAGVPNHWSVAAFTLSISLFTVSARSFAAHGILILFGFILFGLTWFVNVWAKRAREKRGESTLRSESAPEGDDDGPSLEQLKEKLSTARVDTGGLLARMAVVDQANKELHSDLKELEGHAKELREEIQILESDGDVDTQRALRLDQVRAGYAEVEAQIEAERSRLQLIDAERRDIRRELEKFDRKLGLLARLFDLTEFGLKKGPSVIGMFAVLGFTISTLLAPIWVPPEELRVAAGGSFVDLPVYVIGDSTDTLVVLAGRSGRVMFIASDDVLARKLCPRDAKWDAPLIARLSDRPGYPECDSWPSRSTSFLRSWPAR